VRYRITVRGLGIELRGRMDTDLDEDQPTLGDFSNAMKPFGLVVASPAKDDYDPFGITEPDYPPSPEQSMEVITGMWQDSGNPETFIVNMAMLHFGQANVIRGERYQREQAEAELRDRELHHFEVEQENARLKGES
jgi:hypothetical protein